MFDQIAQSIPYQNIETDSSIQLTMKRLDCIHPQISGNKFYKLKYNLIEAQTLGLNQIITFGGAYSNHIAATAYAAKLFGFESIGIIRGEELAHKPLNQTLTTAHSFGMKFRFISRNQYKEKDQISFLNELNQNYPQSYIIPEGGTNTLAIQGCREILTDEDRSNYDVICCAVGTGGTILGLIETSHRDQLILGFSALKGDFLAHDLAQLTTQQHWKIIDDYCFGGYAKTNPVLINFIKEFEQKFSIPLEPIYTGKMLYGIFDLVKKGYFAQNTRILVIHSGGLQARISDL